MRGLYQVIMRLNLEPNCFSGFALSSVDKNTTETQSFVSVIANIPTPTELVITQFADQVDVRFILLLIRDISRVLKVFKWHYLFQHFLYYHY